MKKSATARGQGLTEYIITVALIAIAAIGVKALFGDSIRSMFGSPASAPPGQTSPANTAQKSQAAPRK